MQLKLLDKYKKWRWGEINNNTIYSFSCMWKAEVFAREAKRRGFEAEAKDSGYGSKGIMTIFDPLGGRYRVTVSLSTAHDEKRKSLLIKRGPSEVTVEMRELLKDNKYSLPEVIDLMWEKYGE